MSKAMIAALKTAETENGVIRMSEQFRDMIVSELETLELLKEQEPRVLTPDEIIGWDGYVYGEYRHGVMDVALIVMGIENNRHKGTWATKNLNWDEYGKLWRYWSAMPTNEQRKAVEWDAAD